jgi:hypothetical protein
MADRARKVTDTLAEWVIENEALINVVLNHKRTGRPVAIPVGGEEWAVTVGDTLMMDLAPARFLHAQFHRVPWPRSHV